jgi:hypothetical protein
MYEGRAYSSESTEPKDYVAAVASTVQDTAGAERPVAGLHN